MRRIVIAFVVGLSFAAPAYAHDDPVGAIAESFLRGLVQERDIGLVFDYLRESLDAAAEGREVPPPERLRQRAEAIGSEAKRRGAVAGHAVLDVIEQSVREIFRNPPPPGSL